MACASAAALPSLFLHPVNQSRRPACLADLRGSHSRRGFVSVVAKAAGDSSGASSGSIVKFFRDAWGKSEDRIALIGLGFAGIVATWASINLVEAIDSLPFVPSALEFVGIVFSWWFVYRYLLFKPDRKELVESLKSSLTDILSK